MDTPGLDRFDDRISELCEAMLRISASLDVDTVLKEIVDSACRSTNARCGAITTIDASGQPADYVFTGLTADERRALSEWPSEALKLFAHLRDLPGPLRLPDLPSLVRSLGFSSIVIPCKTFQGRPMRHRGEYVGSFFLGDKQGGGAFTDEDEQMLALFAAQAASAIVNSRTHRDERRARAGLEALVDTAPVGVVVFDAATGAPKSMNRTAVRIVARLHSPGQSPLELLEVLTARRADGRVVSLDELSVAETLRGEEIELSLPDGQSVRTLINATPIRRRDDRFRGGHPAGSGADRGAGALPFGLPQRAHPRTAYAGCGHQGLDRHRVARLARDRPRRDESVLSNHRPAGGPVGRADRRSARCGTHRHRHAGGGAGARRSGSAGRGQFVRPRRRGCAVAAQQRSPVRPPVREGIGRTASGVLGTRGRAAGIGQGVGFGMIVDERVRRVNGNRAESYRRRQGAAGASVHRVRTGRSGSGRPGRHGPARALVREGQFLAPCRVRRGHPA